MTPAWLSQLAPAHAPPPPGWWPPAPGWWLMAVLLLALSAAGVWWWLDPCRRSRRAALRELRAIRAEEYDAASRARAIESLLRRFALAVFGNARVARLTGDAWLTFVADHGGAALAGEAGRSLLSNAFGGCGSDERESWISGADAFVRASHRSASRLRRRAPGPDVRARLRPAGVKPEAALGNASAAKDGH